jgi:hypothetical protein
MGLDMYLLKKTYVKAWDFQAAEDKTKVTVKKGGKPFPGIRPSRIMYVIEEVGYWRKFNALHNWFVKNVQDGVDDCGEYYVSKGKLEELLMTLEAVNENPKVAADYLPPRSGFFFGNTDIDNYYKEEVKETIKLVKALIKEHEEFSPSYYYQSSW